MRHEKKTKLDDILILGTFSYDRTSGLLMQHDGKVVHMRRQSLDVLSVLAAHADEVVSKDNLIKTVWPGIATTDDSLVQCIADIRRTLGRDVIETFPKQGYRLRPKTRSASTISSKNIWDSRFWAIIVCCLVTLTALPFFLPALWDPDTEKAIVPPEVSPDQTLAVLPFVNLGSNPDLRYFSDGLSEDLTTDLSKVERLTVISHASSFDFPDAEKNFRRIAEDLGVRYLVRGTVRHHAERVRINVSLVDPYGGFNLWAERFDWDMAHPFEFQEEVTRQIVQALSLTLGMEKDVTPSVEPDAYYMLLRGLEPLRALTARGNEEAREYFKRALELEPGYARAYANIAVTYGRETIFRYREEISKVSIDEGLEAAITAIRLDPDIPDAYFALSVLNLALGEHANALAAARHAIRLDGNYSDGYALLAEVAVHGGELNEALAAVQRAKLLHPRHPFSYDWIEGHILFHLERYDEAQPFLEDVVGSNPDFYRGLITLAANYGQQGAMQEATDVLSDILTIKPDFALAKEAEQTPYRFEERRERLAQGLRLAVSKQ